MLIVNKNYLILCFIIHTCFCYTYEIFGFLGPIIVLFFLYTFNNNSTNKNKLISLGIYWTKKDFLFFILGFCISSLLAFIIFTKLNFIADFNESILPLAFIFGQTLCEEIFLGFIPITYAWTKLKNKHSFFFFVLCLSTIFMLGHQFFYTNMWRFKSEPLLVSTLITLFCFGVIRSILYIIFENISFAWGIHLAWNICFLVPKIYLHNIAINESQIFNQTLSNKLLSILLVFPTVFLIMYLFSKKKYD